MHVKLVSIDKPNRKAFLELLPDLPGEHEELLNCSVSAERYSPNDNPNIIGVVLSLKAAEPKAKTKAKSSDDE